ncbi:MAG: response regulator transcription factor [Spirochaetaceae bacterium]|jgi:two-component system response regulator RegX3|nr:response regulator transcription factor [Spirochaetaceae bacterium]
MKAKVLIVEDVTELAELVSLYLEKEGMETVRCETAEDALSRLTTFVPDLVILDLNLPGMDGFEFLQRFRKSHSIPVLIMSARDADEDIISGLGGGADEFVTKPFSPRVLVARVRALIRRAQDNSAGEEREALVAFGDFTLYLGSCILKKAGVRIPLSAREFGILSFFAKNPGKPLLPELIYREVWNNAYGDLSAVAVYVQRLRKKIEADPKESRFIETVFGMGYRFVPEGFTEP